MATKKEIYQLSIKLFGELEPHTWCGLCHTLSDAILQLDHGTDFDTEHQLNSTLCANTWKYVTEAIESSDSPFPEIFMQKPEKVTGWGYWFDPLDRTSRIAVLERAIKMIEDHE